MRDRATFAVDAYVVDTLMPDLIGHDHRPAAFIVYLRLWRETRARRRPRVALSLATLALDTGLSKSAVQTSLRHLKRRKLVSAHQGSPTSVPAYTVHAPWGA
jgi:hypothetical protein